MTSNDGNKSRNNPDRKQSGRIVEDETGRSVWEGTISTIKLSILKTGIFRGSKVREALQELQDQGKGDASVNPSEEIDLGVTDAGFNPYDSSWKK